MKTRENRFSIRKLSVGASSVVVATLLFMGGGSAQAAEKQQEVGTPETASAQSIGDKDTHATKRDKFNQLNKISRKRLKLKIIQIIHKLAYIMNIIKLTMHLQRMKLLQLQMRRIKSTTVKSEKPASNSDNQQTEAKQTSKPTTNDGITKQQSESSKQEEPSTQSTDTASKEDDTIKKTIAHTQSQTDETSDNKKKH